MAQRRCHAQIRSAEHEHRDAVADRNALTQELAAVTKATSAVQRHLGKLRAELDGISGREADERELVRSLTANQEDWRISDEQVTQQCAAAEATGAARLEALQQQLAQLLRELDGG